MSADSATQPHLDSSALIVIDVQQDFLDGGSSPIAGTTEVLPQLQRLTAAFREAGRPIFHVIRLYDGEDVDLVRRQLIADGAPIVRPGTDGARVPAALLPTETVPDAARLMSGDAQQVGPAEWLLWKPRWSAFYRTTLESALRELGVDTVVVAGCNLPNCPRATIFDASERDLRIVLVPDAVSQCTDERLADVERLGVRLWSADSVTSALPPRA